jgi:integrase
VKEHTRILNKYVLPRWGKRDIAGITRTDVRDLLERIVTKGKPVMANRTFEVIRLLFNWCVETEILPASPMANLKKPVEKKSERDRTLDDNEIRLVMDAAKQLGAPFGAAVQMMLLTGQRRSEVSDMTWAEIDIEKRLWSLSGERTKNGVAHTVPLSEQALRVIEQQPRLGEFIFTFDGNHPISNFTQYRQRLAALLPATMPPFTLHDLRRSVASGLARIGVPVTVAEKVLNHISGSFGGITGIYQRHTFDGEKKSALEAWGAHVATLTTGIRRVA